MAVDRDPFPIAWTGSSPSIGWTLPTVRLFNGRNRSQKRAWGDLSAEGCTPELGLNRVQLRILPVTRNQLLVVTVFGNSPILHGVDPIGVDDRRQTVGDCNDCILSLHRLDCSLDLLFQIRIEIARGFIED